jgi:hypothetical protein
MANEITKPRCFIAMPITTHPDESERYGDTAHWSHVMEHLFVPAIEAVGYEAVRPIAKGSSMIHAGIIKNLEECDMVLCDLSSQNANVVFELGVRTSLNKPIAIVRDDKTEIPFDLGVLNAHRYSSDLRPWSIAKSLPSLQAHLEDAEGTCQGTNPMWQQYGLTVRAETPVVEESRTDAKLDLVLGQLQQLASRQQAFEDQIAADIQWPALEHKYKYKYNLGRVPGTSSGSLKTVEEARQLIIMRLKTAKQPGEVRVSTLAGLDLEIHLGTDAPEAFKRELANFADGLGVHVGFFAPIT